MTHAPDDPDCVCDRCLAAILDALEADDPLAKYCPHDPTPRQAAFLALRCLEALFGGSAGGGKSDALLMAALQYVHVPGYSALLLRRTFKQLEGADGLVQRAHEWLSGTDAVWRASEMCWTFPSGATLRFGHIQYEANKTDYQGHALQFVGYDETTHFTETMWSYLLTRIRRPESGPLSAVPLRIRGATNPGGLGHAWVMRRFGLRVDGTQDRAKALDVEAGEVREFVPAKLIDNPHLDATSYRRNFSGVDSITRDQLEHGKWVQDGQGLVYRFSAERNVVPLEAWLRVRAAPGWHYTLAIDLGASQSKPTTAFVIVAWSDFDHHVYAVRSWRLAGMTATTDADEIAKVRAELASESLDLDWVTYDAGALGQAYGREFAVRFGESMIQAAKKSDKLGHRRMLNASLERGDLLIVDGQNDDLIGELGELQWNEAGTDAAPGLDDHLTDALLYGWRASLGHAAEPPANEPAHGSPEWGRLEEQRMEQRSADACRKASEDWTAEPETDPAAVEWWEADA